MHAVRHATPRAFLDRAEPWLLAVEDEHNLILSLAYARAERDPVAEDLFATVEHGGAVLGCAFRTPPHKLGVTWMPHAAVPSLVDAVAEAFEEIPGVLGPRGIGETVATTWVALRAASWKLGVRQRIYRLDRVTAPEGVRGSVRVAGPDDLSLAIEWADGFARDAGHQFATSKESIERWIERGSLHLWEDSESVSMAVAQGRTPNGIRVGFVYTPPELRGKGYASACVAEVSARMLASGLRFCVLYTDLDNPTSNAIYRRLGYRPICDAVDCDIVAR